MVRSLRIRGPFLGPSGYDNHVRQFVRALSQRGIGIDLVNLEGWGPVTLPYELRDPWFESLSREGPPTSSVLQFCFPDQVIRDPHLPTLNFTMFEGTRIPEWWASTHKYSDLVLVPTEHSLRAWVDSGVPESKMRLCPLGVRADLFRPGVRPLQMTHSGGRPIDSYATRFLNVSELGRRKNFVGLLTAWLRATSKEDDAVLILKVGAYNPGSLAEFELETQQAEARAGKRLADAADVHVVSELFPDADMPRIFAAATHYISLSLGEGWDLSMIQAGASGLRLIAPRSSAYVAYLNDDVATLVTCRERPALPKDGSWQTPFLAGVNWWEPDADEAVQAIRSAISGRDISRRPVRDHIAENFTWEKATDRLVEILDEAEAMSARR